MQTELLAGQKLQGVLTSNEVQSILRVRGWESRFPLFTTINGADACCAPGHPLPCDLLWAGPSYEGACMQRTYAGHDSTQ